MWSQYPTECKTLGDLRRLVQDCTLPDSTLLFVWDHEDGEGLMSPFFLETGPEEESDESFIVLEKGPFAYGQTFTKYLSDEKTHAQQEYEKRAEEAVRSK